MTIEYSPLHDRFWYYAKEKVELFSMVDTEKTQLIFGARASLSPGHDYHIFPTMSLDEIAQIEKDKSITLPAEFKSYLLKFGAGGAGPAYGVVNLREAFANATFDRPFVYKKHYAEDGIEDFSGLMYIGTAGCGSDYFIELKGLSVGQIYCNWGDGGSDSDTGTIRDFYAEWLDNTSSAIIRHQHQKIQELEALTKANNNFYSIDEYNEAKTKIIESNATLFECHHCQYPVHYNLLTLFTWLSILGVPLIVGMIGDYLFDSWWWFYLVGLVVTIVTMALLSDEITSKPSRYCPACEASLTKPLKKIT